MKFNKPKLLTAYQFMDGMFMVGTEKKVRGWCAEQGPSKRILKVKLSVQKKPK